VTNLKQNKGSLDLLGGKTVIIIIAIILLLLLIGGASMIGGAMESGQWEIDIRSACSTFQRRNCCQNFVPEHCNSTAVWPAIDEIKENEPDYYEKIEDLDQGDMIIECC